MIEGLHIDVTASESNRHLERRIHSECKTFTLGAATVDRLFRHGGRS